MKLLRLILLMMVGAATAAAGTVTGVVRNGTSGKVAAGVDVILIQLQGGMNSVASTKTDAQGNYKLDDPNVGTQPMLIRAVYRGVMFHQPVVPGTTKVDVTVYEPTSDAKTVKVGSRVIVFQPNNASLLVGEEYSLQNGSQPPLAYFNEKGDFDFKIPEGAQLSQVSSWGPAGMPVVQGTIDRGQGQYAIAYAFQPGDNGVRLAYEVPYTANQTRLKFDSQYAVQRIMLVAPPSVKIDSDGFVAAGTEQGFNLYSRDAVPAGFPFEVAISGSAPAPSSAPQGGDPQAQGQDQVNGRETGAAIQTMPNRLDSLKWILIVGFAALFALGVTMIWRRPMPMVADGMSEAMPPPVVRPTGPRAGRKQIAPSRAAPVAATYPAATATTVAASPAQAAVAVAPVASTAELAGTAGSVEATVERSLDALKDKMFRLELRHQAGTISDEEYARERSRTEQILRELLRG
jgi:hypothetical protein